MKVVTWVLLAFLIAFPIYWRRIQNDMIKRAEASQGGEVKEAFEILNLAPGAGLEDIRKAYRRKIQQVHPDAGGDELIAARINRARDVLIKNAVEKKAA